MKFKGFGAAFGAVFGAVKKEAARLGPVFGWSYLTKLAPRHKAQPPSKRRPKDEEDQREPTPLALIAEAILSSEIAPEPKTSARAAPPPEIVVIRDSLREDERMAIEMGRAEAARLAEEEARRRAEEDEVIEVAELLVALEAAGTLGNERGIHA